MPMVEITLAEGRTPQQIRTLLAAVSDAVHRSIGVPKANIRVVVREVPPTHWCAGGVTLAERAAAAKET
ncbi:tautomerase family protein [Amycolatopsis acidiphila]|nr:2-hydroxymuconate tautomerase [Amycolatopsis acidiphila]UIJ59767.1 tautomerase family protein [Amycolatopsis acidiphila]GHG98405.1 4-oxalocrotonate tautomerase [Amycolatopsis acidiphila]